MSIRAVSVADRPTQRLAAATRSLTAIRAHARAEAPREACGIIIGSAPAASGGVPLRWEPNNQCARLINAL